jgi:hypothetical protein
MSDNFEERLADLYKIGNPLYRCVRMDVMAAFFHFLIAAKKQNVLSNEVQKLQKLFDDIDKQGKKIGHR